MLACGLMGLLVLTSCGDSDVNSAKAIIGRTYVAYGNAPVDYLAYSFLKNEKATITIGSASNREDVYDALTYSISGLDVVVRYDYSDAWAQEYQGQIQEMFTYDPSKDQLVNATGTVFERQGATPPGGDDPKPDSSGDIERQAPV